MAIISASSTTASQRFSLDSLSRAVRRTRLILLVLIICFSIPLLSDTRKKSPDVSARASQKNRQHCVTPELRHFLEKEYEKNPQLRQNYEEAVWRLEREGLEREASYDGPNAAPYVIPVVFHIVHARGVENIPDYRIQEAMQMLEQDFTATNPDLSEVISPFQHLKANLQIQFKLAQKDPNGYPTTGITRDLSDYTYNGVWDFPELKEVNVWPRNKYLNVWICYSSNGSNGSAWAYLPSQVDNGSGYENLDGVVMSYWCMGKTTAGYYRILTHEIGHVMNLEHTWGPGDFQGANACNEDDSVADTPNCHGYYGGCDLNYNSCGGLNMIQNYMDYAQCSVLFTPGQKTRVHNCLESGVSSRNQLWSSSSLSQTLYSSATPRVIYSHPEHAANLLMESDENNGAISSTLDIRLTDVSSSQYFKITSGNMTAGTHYTVANVPAGLTAVVKGVSATAASLTLSGSASAHANANDVNNLTLTFLGGAFTGNSAAGIVNVSDNHLKIDFKDPYQIIYSDIPDIVCNSSASWTYFRLKQDSPLSSDFGLWLYNANNLKLETYKRKLICQSGTRNITPLAYGADITGASAWTAPGDYPNQLDIAHASYTSWNGKTAYVGCQIKILGKIHYGWLRIQVNAAGTSMTLLDYAWNPKPETPIKAGSKDFNGGSESVTANFTFTTSLLQASFTDASTAVNTTISEWEWNFGDGNVSTLRNPTHTYAAPGSYTVTLSVSNGGSAGNSISKTVAVTSGGLSYCASSGKNSTYEWIAGVKVGLMNNLSGQAGYTDFTSITANLTSGAAASVTLTPGFASSAYTEKWKIWIDYNKDGDFADTGEAVFSGSGNGVVSGSFTPPVSANGVSTRMRVSMKYNADPSYCENFDYGEVEDYTVVISAGVGSAPVAQFIGSPTVISVGQSVSFTDQSSNNPTTWQWTFPGGSPASSSAQNPSVVYNTLGTYNVTLTATNSYGSNTITKTGYITISGGTVSYCAISFGSPSGQYMTRVKVGSIDNTSTYAANGYSDYSSTSTVMSRGTGYPLTVTPKSSWAASKCGVYIDWNRNGVFTDSGELVYSYTGAGPWNAVITPPAGAAVGSARMRVIAIYNATLSPCGSAVYFGEAEDYTLNIQ